MLQACKGCELEALLSCHGHPKDICSTAPNGAVLAIKVLGGIRKQVSLESKLESGAVFWQDSEVLWCDLSAEQFRRVSLSLRGGMTRNLTHIISLPGHVLKVTSPSRRAAVQGCKPQYQLSPKSPS